MLYKARRTHQPHRCLEKWNRISLRHRPVRRPSAERSTNNSALAFFDELDEQHDLFVLWQFLADGFDRLAGVEFRTINQAKRFLDPFHALGRIIFPFQTDEIDTANFCRIAIGDHERRNILHNFGTTARNGESSDAAKLMHGGEAAHHRVVTNLDMAGERAVVRKNHFVSNLAIVPNVTVSEKASPAADPRLSFTRRAAADRDKFAKRIFIADFQISRLALILQVLGLLPDRAGSIKFISCTRAHRPTKRDMLLQPAIWAEHDVGPDYAIWPHDGSRSDLCASIDNRRRMNLRVAHLSRNVNISSPSETTASFTTQ